MTRTNLLWVLAAASTAFNCSFCQPIRPGEVGEECTFDTDCKQGLLCVQDRCASTVADAGPSDAASGDGNRSDLAGTDLVGRDLAVADHAVADHVAVDGAVPDHAGVDVVALDHAATDHQTGLDTAAADHHAADATPPDIGLGDISSRFDHALPDVAGRDWTGRDLDIFVDGGINIDAGIIGYDGGYQPGVACGNLTCTGTQHCCVGFGPTFSCADTCSGVGADLQCDDTEDCGNTGECCGTGLRTFCIATGTCLGAGSNNYLVCTNGSNCTSHSMVCCSASLFSGTGVELGWCQLGTCQ